MQTIEHSLTETEARHIYYNVELYPSNISSAFYTQIYANDGKEGSVEASKSLLAAE